MKTHEHIYKYQQKRWYGPELFGPPWCDVTGDPQQESFAYPPATEEQIRVTENHLGLSLPGSLKSLYMEVANGGFGPGCGIRGAVGGYTWYDQTIVEAYQSYRAIQIVDLSGQFVHWPKNLLPLCDLGCDQEVCLDMAGQVVVIAPTKRRQETVLLMKAVSSSLEAWLDTYQ